MQARKIFDSDQEAAVLLAAQSMKAYPSKEAEYILRNNNLPKLVSQESYESHVESYEGDEYGIKASSSDGRYQAKGKYFDQSFIMVNAAGESEIPIDGLLTALAISPEGNFLAAGVCVGDLVLDNRCAQTYIFLWNTTTDEIIARVPQEGEVFDIRFIRFGGEADYLVASGGNNGMVRIWMTTCAFGNNCELARAGTVVADLQNGVHANSMAVSSDNNFIVVGGCDHIYYGECEKGVVRVWELQSEDYVEVAKVVLQGDVAAVDFYSNGQFTVISGGLFDKLLSRWDFANRDVEDTCSLVTRNLTHAEWDQYIGDVLPYQAVCPNLPIEPEAAVTPTP
jgi:WD40 repeat protein